jgi:hypothetical protein
MVLLGALVGRFEAAANGIDGEGEPIALLRWACCVLAYLQGMSRPLWEVAHLGDVVEDLLQEPIDLDALLEAHSSGSLCS